jgi:photosystem II stability/assembly factor-like uncharacterized protein
MFKKLFTVFTFLTYLTSQSHSQWNELNTFEQKVISKLNFINDDLGYALGYDLTVNKKVIIKTTNGGNSWEPIPIIDQNEFMDICFIGDSVGFSVFRDLSNSVAPMRIYKTFDDGLNWEDISPDSTNTGMGNSVIQFIDENIGFLGVAHVLYRTIDGGNNWDTTLLNNVSIMSLDFINENSGVIGTWDNSFFYSGSMYSTNDGGETFNIFNLNQYSSVVHYVKYLNSGTVYASCTDEWFSNAGSPFICKSLDNGISWDSIPISSFNIDDATLSRVDFKDELNGKIVLKTPFNDTAYIFKTTDGAQSWAFEDTVYLYEVSDLQITSNSAYVTGDENELYKYSSSLDIKDDFKKEPDIRIYPNPAISNSSINIESTYLFEKATLFDFSGRKLFECQVVNNTFKIPNLKRGFYCLKIKSKSKISSSYFSVN